MNELKTIIEIKEFSENQQDRPSQSLDATMTTDSQGNLQNQDGRAYVTE